MDARPNSVGLAAGAAHRLAQLLAELDATTKRLIPELVAAMPIVILVRATREALADRARRRTSDAGESVGAG